MVDFAQKPNTGSEPKAIESQFDQRPGAGALSRPTTRRNFIVYYLTGLLGATGLALVLPLLVFIFPPEGSSKKLDVKVTLDKPLNAIQNGEAVNFQAPKDQGFVMVDGGGDNAAGKIAFSAYAVKDLAGKLSVFAVNCSHLGCSIQLNQGAHRFECPCHGSMFNLNGSVLHGPAAFPLSHLGWKEGANANEVLVQGLQLGGIA
jgi:menaquinol-cytochrome c reductase iron-sulfur subunit